MFQDEEGQSICKPCTAGYYCLGETSKPIICPQGSYCPSNDTIGSNFPVRCPPGTFGAGLGLESLSHCSDCLPGHYCAQAGLSFPDGLCDPGYYCSGGAYESAPTDDSTGGLCSPGGYCDIGSRAPINCPPGTYYEGEGARSAYDCQPCDAGQYCLGSGSPTPDGDCDPGYYCPVGSQVASQVATEPGYYAPAGQAEPILCAEGYY